MAGGRSTYYLDNAKQLPHADIIQKPVILEKVFDTIYEYLNLDSYEHEQFSDHYRLKQLKDYYSKMESWLEKFGGILEN
jgi:hypothetical protein